MKFVTFTFLVFLAVVFLGSKIWKPHERGGRIWLCLASLVFYGWWYPPYLIILLLTGYVDYWCALRMPTSPQPRLWLVLSLCANVGVLLYFKYAAFFAREGSLWLFPGQAPIHLAIILPLGISFYTFQSMSYTIDVYRGNLKPEKNASDYFMYLAFFPHLVAGPIVRAVDFLPQVKHKTDLSFDDWRVIAYRICRGFFLKLVVADNVAVYVDQIFSREPMHLGFWDSWLGAVLFSIQIFSDFAGYSDIAIGCAKIFGITLRENFLNPFVAVGFEDFWRRWHISLSTWFRDYLYVPLGGNKVGSLRNYLNIAIVFLLSGLWHGANWTFVLWGGLHGFALIVQKWFRKAFAIQPMRNAVLKACAFVGTFLVVELFWVPFHSPSVHDTVMRWKNMVGFPVSASSDIWQGNAEPIGFFLLIFMMFVLVQWFKERIQRPFDLKIGYIEALFYFTLLLIIPGAGSDFIYFQF